MDERHIKVKGVLKCLFRAVDKQGKTVDFLSTADRNVAAAKRFFDKAMRYIDVHSTETMDIGSTNKAALDHLYALREIPIKIQQVKYLNNIVKQEHRAVKRVTRPMLGFKSFRAA